MGNFRSTDSGDPNDITLGEHGSANPDMTDEQRSLERFGEHLSDLLRAAREVATKIEKETREEAGRTLAEAGEKRSEAEEWARQIRAEAESDADQRRLQAETEARAIVSAAEQRAAAIDEDAQLRQQALTTDISLAENRLRQLASGLHEAGNRLEELLAAPDERGGAEAGPTDDSLVAALAPSRGVEGEAAT